MNGSDSAGTGWWTSTVTRTQRANGASPSWRISISVRADRARVRPEPGRPRRAPRPPRSWRREPRRRCGRLPVRAAVTAILASMTAQALVTSKEPTTKISTPNGRASMPPANPRSSRQSSRPSLLTVFVRPESTPCGRSRRSPGGARGPQTSVVGWRRGPAATRCRRCWPTSRT